MMKDDSSQGSTLDSIQWQTSDTQQQQRQQQHSLFLEKMTETPILEDTIAVVKEKVWSFRDAWNGFAEVLCGFGVTPSIVGYSSVPLHEEGYVKEQDEGEMALQSVAKSEVLSRRSKSGISKESFHNDSTLEEANLLHRNEEEDDVNHAFVMSSRLELDQRKSLTRPVNWEDDDDELGEDKKEK